MIQIQLTHKADCPPISDACRRSGLRLALALLISLAGCASAHPHSTTQSDSKPLQGLVPDSSTAAALASVVIDRLAGRDSIRGDRTLTATDHGDSWHIRHSNRETVRLEIFKLDARIHHLGPRSEEGIGRDELLPDTASATRFAEIILRRAYGETALGQQRPLRVSRQADTWRLMGQLRPNRLGGVATIEIDATSGRVAFVSHGR